MILLPGSFEGFGMEDRVDIECAAIVLEIVDDLLAAGIAGRRAGEFFKRQIGKSFGGMEVEAMIMPVPGGPYPIGFFDEGIRDAPFLQGGCGGQAGHACADDEDFRVHG